MLRRSAVYLLILLLAVLATHVSSQSAEAQVPRWQTSAPRITVNAGSTIQLGLRNANGAPGECYSIYSEVYDPSFEYYWLEFTVCGAGWYYSDFNFTYRGGTYVVYYLIGETVIASDSFTVAQPTPVSTPRTERVRVITILDSSDEVIVARANGQRWLLEYGIGCLSLWRYEGREIIVSSPGVFFAGIGSEIILPNNSGKCRIWDSELL